MVWLAVDGCCRCLTVGWKNMMVNRAKNRVKRWTKIFLTNKVNGETNFKRIQRENSQRMYYILYVLRRHAIPSSQLHCILPSYGHFSSHYSDILSRVHSTFCLIQRNSSYCVFRFIFLCRAYFFLLLVIQLPDALKLACISRIYRCI